MKQKLSFLKKLLVKPAISAWIFLFLVLLGTIGVIASNNSFSLNQITSSSTTPEGNDANKLTVSKWDSLIARVAEMNGNITTNTTNITSLSWKVNINTNNISTLSWKLSTLSGTVSTLLSNTSSSVRTKNGNNIYYNGGKVQIGTNDYSSITIGTGGQHNTNGIWIYPKPSWSYGTIGLDLSKGLEINNYPVNKPINNTTINAGTLSMSGWSDTASNRMTISLSANGYYGGFSMWSYAPTFNANWQEINGENSITISPTHISFSNNRGFPSLKIRGESSTINTTNASAKKCSAGAEGTIVFAYRFNDANNSRPFVCIKVDWRYERWEFTLRQ